jgi:hypothetical protein
MKKVRTFARGTERRRVSVRGVEIELEVDERVFPPSANGTFYADNRYMKKRGTVIRPCPFVV